MPELGGKRMFVPSLGATLAVAAALAVACVVVLAQARLLTLPLPRIVVRVASAGLGTVFLARAVGAFRVIGFFKSVTGTAFARNDTLFFSPLCVALGAAVLWLTYED